MKREGVTSVVALPTHMKAVAEAAGGSLSLRSMLLSAEYVPEEDVMLFEESFGCRVYEHYGMTEMGLGCAVSCGHGDGYHIREADLYIEIIDPETGRVIHDDTPGEVVFTTLTRKGMPFIRYMLRHEPVDNGALPLRQCAEAACQSQRQKRSQRLFEIRRKLWLKKYHTMPEI